MSVGLIESLWRYPLKGTRGFNSKRLYADETVGIVGDRHLGIVRLGEVSDEWRSKAAFYAGQNTAHIVAETPLYSDEAEHLDPRYLESLAKRLGVAGPLKVQDTKGAYSLCDTKGGYVSFLNLATLKVLSDFAKQDISPYRFRMNVWLSGLKPFEELEWVNRVGKEQPGTIEIMVGNVRMRVDDACERCEATRANPATGIYDLETLELIDGMMQKYMPGYLSPKRRKTCVMGILAAPLERGTFHPGETVRLA